MADRIVLVLAVTGVPVMIGDAVRWFRGADGCRACGILGQVPYGPPYWLLRAHLRRAARGPRDGEPSP